ncbi:MAG: hypothetical protein IKD83_01715 [Firmicutes bacterium]|nr:hypothetical protein [Bacillota bacterium]
MSQGLMTRLKKVENYFYAGNQPSLIWISYDEETKLYRVDEDYYRKAGNRRKTYYLEHYREYVFNPNYRKLVFMDLINAPENGIFIFKCSEIRKKAGIPRNTAFSLDYNGGDSNEIEIEPFEVVCKKLLDE